MVDASWQRRGSRDVRKGPVFTSEDDHMLDVWYKPEVLHTAESVEMSVEMGVKLADVSENVAAARS
jgi:hypothetical protein